jgi:hypothetical protein
MSQKTPTIGSPDHQQQPATTSAAFIVGVRNKGPSRRPQGGINNGAFPSKVRRNGVRINLNQPFEITLLSYSANQPSPASPSICTPFFATPRHAGAVLRFILDSRARSTDVQKSYDQHNRFQALARQRVVVEENGCCTVYCIHEERWLWERWDCQGDFRDTAFDDSSDAKPRRALASGTPRKLRRRSPISICRKSPS